VFVVTPCHKTLARSGLEWRITVLGFALLARRLDTFDVEVISLNLRGRLWRGVDVFDQFRSKSASTEGSSNYGGLTNEPVDKLLDKVLGATTRPEQIASLRALDRVLRFEFYNVPAWYSGVHRVSYRNHLFEQPVVAPTYYQAEDWALSTWWAAQKSAQKR